MKKLIAILLIAIYLFNLAGYSLVFHYFILQSEEKFTVLLDQNKYNDDQLVELSIPLNLPYMQNSEGYERVDGTVEKDGIEYNYVKRRIFNGTLYIMCLPNQQRTQLIKEKSRYAGEVNDFAAAAKKEKESTAKKAGPATEYNNIVIQYSLTSLKAPFIQLSNYFAFFLPAAATDTSEHPPQTSC